MSFLPLYLVILFCNSEGTSHTRSHITSGRLTAANSQKRKDNEPPSAAALSAWGNKSDVVVDTKAVVDVERSGVLVLVEEGVFVLVVPSGRRVVDVEVFPPSISVVVFAGNGIDSVVVSADAVVVVRIGDGLTVVVVAVAMG